MGYTKYIYCEIKIYKFYFEDMAPSFEEMSQSIDDIIRRSNPTNMNGMVTISVQQQLVLACAWLNLKVSKLDTS